MRTASWVSGLLIACLSFADCNRKPNPPRNDTPAATTTAASGPARVTGSGVQGGETVVDVQVSGGRSIRLVLPRDATVGPETAPERTTVVGEVPGTAIVLTDTYSSLAGGMSYCQAGEEQFLRVVPLAQGAPHDLATIKLASCRENLELADPGVDWIAPSRTVRIHWLSGPGGRPEVRDVVIGADGRVQRQP